MKIDELHLQAVDIPAMREYYTGMLGLQAVGAEADALALQAGSTLLRFGSAPPEWDGFYHFAFNIPETEFAQAKAWLSARVPLIPDSSHADEFFSESWNAHSIYFYDPAGNILEFIARHNLPENEPLPPFAPESIQCVSEIGIATEDVLNTVASIQENTGANVYSGEGSDTFTAVGDEHGLLIVVKVGRIWFPDTGKPAWPGPIRVALTTARGEHFELSGPPYSISALPAR